MPNLVALIPTSLELVPMRAILLPSQPIAFSTNPNLCPPTASTMPENTIANANGPATIAGPFELLPARDDTIVATGV